MITLALHAGPRRRSLTSGARRSLNLQLELYFLADPIELRQPLNLRNEAAAVSLLLSYLPSSKNDAGCEEVRVALNAHCQKLWPQFTPEEAASCLAVYPPNDSPAVAFERSLLVH